MFIVLAGFFELKKLLSDDIKGHRCASKYTMGQRIEDTDPKRYKAICDDLKGGKNLATTMRDNRAGSEAVSRIKNELLDSGQLKDWKRRTAGKAAAIVDKLLDKLDKETDTIKAREIPLAAAVLIDKSTQLTGEPSQIVEHRHEIGQGMAGWLDKKAEQTEQRPANAEIIDINSGLENRDKPQKPEKTD